MNIDYYYRCYDYTGYAQSLYCFGLFNFRQQHTTTVTATSVFMHYTSSRDRNSRLV